MLPRIVEIEIHLTRVRVAETAEFKIDENQASSAPVEEKQIHSIPLIADSQTLLAGNEGEIVAELK